MQPARADPREGNSAGGRAAMSDGRYAGAQPGVPGGMD